ncbi:MAG: arginine--tRNA ligase [Candidatus Magasanikbacteria bacterium]|nr:arginine--tRNA ligase [Candidatus Magasanikbacteria bacterium]
MLDELKKQLKDLLSFEVKLEFPPNKQMGDLAISCFDLAKEQQKNPVEIADDLSQKIKSGNLELIENVESKGPYVNLFLSTNVLAVKILEKIENNEKYGSNNLGKGKKVLIEYPSQNTHKEFHVGHLRNVCIGNVLVNLYKKSGYNVTPINYINDFGAHVAKCLWGIQFLYNGKEPTENKQEWLGKVYAEATKEIGDDPAKKEDVAEIQRKLEAKFGDIYELFQKTREWSMEGFNQIHKELGVNHEQTFFESDIKENGQKKVDELIEKGLAKSGEGGAIIADLEKYGLDIALLRKSNGAGVYMTSDLALAELKKEKYPDIDESINITGVEQNFYFKQLFKILELSNFDFKMTHIGYGLVNLPSGKMSSRKGNVILYKDVYEQVFEYLLNETKQRHIDWSEEKINENVKKLTLAGIKFSMQKHEASKNVVFNIEESAGISGYTGLYVLYTVARINSILRKVENINYQNKKSELKENEEKVVLLKLSQYEDICKKALEDYNPSVITRYCFELTSVFNDFYAKHRIVEAETEKLKVGRILLSTAVKNVLKNALEILSIETVEEM